MSSPSNCNNYSYKTITLQPNEQFTLPPGAEIVGISNPLYVTSTCELPTNLEIPTCYEFIIAGSCNLSPDRQNWEPDNTFFNAFYIDGVKYPLTNTGLDFGSGTQVPIPATVIANFNTALSDASLSSIITQEQVVMIEECAVGTDNGWIISIKVKTIPSIGDNLQLELRTDPSSQAPVTSAYVLVTPSQTPCP